MLKIILWRRLVATGKIAWSERFAKADINKMQDANKIVIGDEGDPVANHRFGTGMAMIENWTLLHIS